MATRCYIWGLSLLCALPVAVGQTKPQVSALELCRRLVEESREVDLLLRTVSDRESGMKAAAELRRKMEYMHRSTEQLGGLPLGSGEAIRALEQMMRDLTHITQGYMPVVQRLVEVNAYGADELIRLFEYYKMTARGSASKPDETPLVQAYAEWCDAVDDVLYQLRRIQNTASASAVVADLHAACQRAEQKAARVESMQNGLSPQQLESEGVSAGRLQALCSEVRSELSRLESAACYGVELVKALLPVLSRVCRG